MSKKYEEKLFKTLSQKLVAEQPYLKDFALNKLALEYAVFKNMLELFNLDKFKCSQKFLEMLRVQGEAIAVSQLDYLSQLSIKVGSTVRRIRL